MKAQILNPIQIALKYDPPTLALVYTLTGPKRFLHEFLFREDDLLSSPEEVYDYFRLSHPGYLDKVSQDQVLRLIQQVQSEWVEEDAGQAHQMQEFLRDVRSRMTEEEYEDFIAKVQSGELVLTNEGEYDGEEFEDEQDNDRF